MRLGTIAHVIDLPLHGLQALEGFLKCGRPSIQTPEDVLCDSDVGTRCVVNLWSSNMIELFIEVPV